ncbi:MAG: hypothetical protein HLX50_06585 [Alteromonadaceae bacterium]|nr:hypothetical protein [Alteromonadaceae bacterium]
MKALLIALVAGAALFGAYNYLATERQAAWDQGYSAAEAEGDKALEALKREHAEKLLAQAQAFEAEQARKERMAREIEQAYLAKRRALHTRITELEDALDEAYTNHYRASPGEDPQPVPQCVFTVGWLRDYNAALGGMRATAARAGKPDAAPWPAPGVAAEFDNSDISQRDLLRHAQRYGRWCQANTEQLTALIEALNPEETKP